MAETLAVLIQLAERRVDDVQRALGMIRGHLREIADQMVRLEQEAAVAFVTAIAEDDVMALQASGAFQERVRREVTRLKELEAQLQGQEREKQRELQACFTEQKRFELLLEKQKLAARKERAKKMQNALDEVAGRKR